MQLTTAIISQFAGGQIEIQNQTEGYTYKGAITSASVDENTLNVTVSMMAKASFPPTSWTKDDKTTYAASLEIYRISNIGSGSSVGDARLLLQSQITGETVVFYPANSNKLDISELEGMN